MYHPIENMKYEIVGVIKCHRTFGMTEHHSKNNKVLYAFFVVSIYIIYKFRLLFMSRINPYC